VKFETAPVHFALAGSGFGWGGSREYREDVARLGHSSIVGVLLRDRDAGRVKVSRKGHPKVHYELSKYDATHARSGLLGAAKVLVAAGAHTLTSLHTPPARVRVAAGWEGAFRAAMDRRGYTRCRMSYVSFHQMGTAAMGHDARTSVVDAMGQSHDVRRLFVADGSVFPASSGVNPMLTIMAIGDHVARSMADRW
jgi:choline dehydrogenase-like flavoprotein